MNPATMIRSNQVRSRATGPCCKVLTISILEYILESLYQYQSARLFESPLVGKESLEHSPDRKFRV